MPDGLRKARPEEAPLLSALAIRSKAYWGYSAEFMEACRDDLSVSQQDIDQNHYVVSEKSGEIVGFYALGQLSPVRCQLDALFVDSGHIGSGQGRALMDHAKSNAIARGFSLMTIHADPNAEKFYLAAGGIPVGEKPSGSIAGRVLPLLEISLEA